MGRLSDLPNIGKTLEDRLLKAGISDSESLKQIGSKEAFTRLRLIESDTCYSALCAIEGAIQGKRWHFMDGETKTELKHFYESLN